MSGEVRCGQGVWRERERVARALIPEHSVCGGRRGCVCAVLRAARGARVHQSDAPRTSCPTAPLPVLPPIWTGVASGGGRLTHSGRGEDGGAAHRKARQEAVEGPAVCTSREGARSVLRAPGAREHPVTVTFLIRSAYMYSPSDYMYSTAVHYPPCTFYRSYQLHVYTCTPQVTTYRSTAV